MDCPLSPKAALYVSTVFIVGARFIIYRVTLFLIRNAVCIVFAVVGMNAHSFAAQLLSASACTFVVHVPGAFGGTNLNYHMQKGALFTENADHKFCGPVAQLTPFGESKGDQCFAIDDGKFISGKWSNKVASSDCVFSDGGAFNTPFDPGNFITWSGDGSASLHGQAFLKTVGGDIKTCAGEVVLLLPGTPYVDELLAKGEAGVSVSPDPRLISLSHRTVCDAQGNFSLSRLPAQKWYVLTRVTWGVPHIESPVERPGPLTALLLGIHAPPAMDQQGGDLIQSAELTPGDNQIFLTERDKR
jgi:hypothetical protein